MNNTKHRGMIFFNKNLNIVDDIIAHSLSILTLKVDSGSIF